MNKISSIIVALSVCIIMVGISSSCSDKEEKEIQGERISLENDVKKDYAGNVKLEFYDQLKKTSQIKPLEDSEELNILMHTLKPKYSQGDYYSMGDCSLTVSVDVDGDKKKEKVCLRYLQYKEYDHVFTYVYLVLDIFKDNNQILRQELDRGFFFEERFVSFKDIDLDEKVELMTKVRFSPDCAGRSSYRIYTFNDDRFELTLNSFNIGQTIPL